MYIRRILVLIAFLVLIAMGAFSYFIYKTLLMPNTDFKEEYTYVHIKNNASYDDVREELKPILKNVDKFDKVARQKKYVNNIKAGRYRIVSGMNNNDILNALRTKNEPANLVFNNQDNIQKLAGRISEQIEADSTMLVKVMQDTAFLNENDFGVNAALNMYIPNQYEFYWNTEAKSFRDRMLKEYKNFWTEERKQKAEDLNLTPHEVQNLAAIVQKETAKVEERKRVAGVYINRLKKGMKLEADPTVIFAVNKERNKDIGLSDSTAMENPKIKRVLYEHLEIDSPYNTYKYEGIPPGPIAMPDISSIDAVLNYENHDFIYFVADPDNFGFHKFSKTLQQHNIYKKRYINWLENH